MGQHATIHGKTTEDFNGQDGKWIPIRVSANGGMAVSSASPDDIVNVYETAPAGYDQQQLATTIVNHGDWQTVAISTAGVLGATGGAAGDYLESLTIVVATSGATAVVTIKDGAGSAITVLPAVPAIGTYHVPLGMKSKTGAWTVTTLAGATAIAHGRFS